MTRRQLLISTPAAAALATAASTSPSPRSRMRTLEGTGRVWEIWRKPGRFTKNPDIVQLPDGRRLLVFCDNDQHWAEDSSIITTLESRDAGKTWGNPQVIAAANIRNREERWVTPRLSRLRSGRLVIICDHDDYHYYHVDRPSGIWMWSSDDEGRTWSKPRLTGVPGIEPGRVLELADGTLLMNAHMVFRDNFKLAEFVMRSTDGGVTWKDLTPIAKDRVHNYCEGHILVHSSGPMACIVRENNHSGYPSYVSFSYDQGRKWSRPQPLPFAGDRPFAGELSDGRVLVTFRNQAGNTGTHAWLGDLFANEGYQVSGVHYGDETVLEDGRLHIRNRPDAETKYVLMPPESFRSDVSMEANLRVAGPADKPLATLNVGRLGLTLYVLRDQIWCDFRRGSAMNPRYNRPRIDVSWPVDMTAEHRLRIATSQGRMWVEVDGKPVIHGVMIKEWPLEDTWFGRARDSAGDVWFRSVSYESVNETEPAFSWSWTAASGRFPDQYKLDRELVIEPNPPVPGQRPDNGYSSFLVLPKDEIYMVDYTNHGDQAPLSHLYAAKFSPEDFNR